MPASPAWWRPWTWRWPTGADGVGGGGQVSAAARLHKKGLTTQVDGGYLTPLGQDAAQQAQTLLRVLSYEDH